MTTTTVDAPSIAAVQGAVASKRTPGWKVALGRLGSVVLSIVVVLAAWEIFLWALNVNPFIARHPIDVWRFVTSDPEAAAHRTALWNASVTTIVDAMLGLFAGAIVGVLCAVVFNLARSVEQTVMPVALAFSAVPLVAMTPLIALIFGRGLMAVTVIAGIVTFFPTLVNVTLSLRSVPSEQIDLMRAYGANDRVTLLKVQFPSSLPALFASMRIAAPLALIGAMLAEWLATGKGMGYLILQSGATFKIDRLWAATFLVTFASVILYTIISAVETVVLARYAPGKSRKVL